MTTATGELCRTYACPRLARPGHTRCDECEPLYPHTTDTEPRCDLCGEGAECSRGPACTAHGGDWNGETGNHRSCELDDYFQGGDR